MSVRPHAPSKGVLIACMPNSGSTYLSALIASLPGYRREHLVPWYDRREQELGEQEIRDAFLATDVLREAVGTGTVTASYRPRGFVAQHHVRYTDETKRLIKTYDLVPVVLVRNIYDVVVSLHDHVAKSSPYTSAAWIDEGILDWPDDRLHEFLVNMVVPWYFNFYVSWWKAQHKLLVTYEDLIRSPRQEVARIARFGWLGWDRQGFDAILQRAGGEDIRMNVGGTGRGSVLDQALRDRIRKYVSYYPDVDFGPIGVPAEAL